ncbi:MAG TPA: alpha/beta hydrolase family protein [Cyclobacteriaceae bacterium]
MTFNKRFLLITILILIAAGFLSYLVQTSGGSVKIYSIKIPTQDGQWVFADLFKPKSATKENPAPLIVVIPGFQRSKEALSNVAIELSRRGMVAVSIDPYAQGFSSSSMQRRAATYEGYGMFPLVEYFASNDVLNYIDKNRIGATGHSAGGNAVIKGASYFGQQAEKTGKPSKLHSVYCSGYVLSLSNKILKHARSNIGAAYAFYDEGAYRNEFGHANMKRAPEALRLINSGFKDSSEFISEVKIGHYYGEVDDRSLRVMFNEKNIHPFQPYMIEATANQLAFFEHVFGINGGLSSTNQIWYWKEILGIISIIAGMLSIVPMGRLLLSTPYFNNLVKEIPPALPRPGKKGKFIFWGLFVLAALIACFSYIPMAELSQDIFVKASTRRQTWFFPQRMNNAVLMWAIFNGIIGFVIFYLTYRFYGKNHGISNEMWGTQISKKELLQTLLLAVIIFSFYYLTLSIIYYFFHIDYRFLFMGVRVFGPDSVILLLMYAPMFFIFFLSNSLRVNAAMRFEGKIGWKDILTIGFGNSLGLIFIVFIQYVTFAITGTVYWTDGWLYVNLLFAVVPMMFVLPIFNRYFFLMTGRIYLGPMVTCLIFIMILLTNTVVYIPL